MRIALCFWGLCRSTERTFESIERFLFNPLKTSGIVYDIYLHTQTINRPYTNKHSSEFNQELNNNAWKLLRPVRSVVEDQDNVDKHLQFSKQRTQGNPWPEDGNDWGTLNNHIRALYSLKQVTLLWKKSSLTYDFILYCRPDVLQRTTFDIQWLKQLQPKTILMPNFGLTANTNDRFAAGRPAEMEIWGNRQDSAYEYSLTNVLHSERFLGEVLKKENVNIQWIRFFFVRLRCNGEICDEDNKL